MNVDALQVKKMAYNNFTLSKVKKDFSLTVNETRNLFAHVEPVTLSDFLKQALSEYVPLATAINTEKARSEWIIAPVMAEVRRQALNQISLFSGSAFDVDQERGLSGYCDFILSASREQFEITAPVMTIVEAKKEDLIGGLGQCIAAMVAAQIFNEKAGNQIKTIYGGVTSGTNWRFLTIQENTVSIDMIEYYIDRVENILGILLLPTQAI